MVPRPPTRSRAAFTLIELLVVIAITAILIGLLLYARASAGRSTSPTAPGGLNPPLTAAAATNATSWQGNRGGSWIWGQPYANGFTAALAPNSTTPDAAGHGQGWLTSRSPFSGGVNAAPADGSVRFFRDSISITTWRALATRAGGEVIDGNDH